MVREKARGEEMWTIGSMNCGVVRPVGGSGGEGGKIDERPSRSLSRSHHDRTREGIKAWAGEDILRMVMMGIVLMKQQTLRSVPQGLWWWCSLLLQKKRKRGGERAGAGKVKDGMVGELPQGVRAPLFDR